MSHYWIFGITLLGLGLRLFQLGEWSFWHDEALTVLLAAKPVPELLAIAASDVHPPLYFLLVKLFLLAGQSETIIRLLSALSGTASIVMLYLVGKELFDPQVALVGAFIIAIAPLQLFYAQEARMYTLLVLLTILTTWTFIRALKKNSWLWWAFFTVGVVLACYTAYFAFFVLVAMVLFILIGYWLYPDLLYPAPAQSYRTHPMFRFFTSLGIVVFLYLPWIGVFLSQTRAVFDTYWIARPSPLLLFTTLSAYFSSYTLPQFWIAVSLACVLLIIFVVLNDVRHAIKQGNPNAPWLGWLLLWCFVPLLGTFLVSLYRPIFQLRTVLTAAPALYLLLAWGVTRARFARLNLLLALPTLAMMLLSIGHFYFNPAYAKPDWRAAARYVDAHTQPNDVVLHTSDGSFLPFLVFPHQVSHIRLPIDPRLVTENAPSQAIILTVGGPPQAIETATEGFRRAWLIVGLDQSPEYQAAQKEEFDNRFQLSDETQVAGIYIFTYDLE